MTKPTTPVFVVMGNDFPSAVFSTEKLADDYCAKRREIERQDFHPTYSGEQYHTRVHWRVYEFPVYDSIEEFFV